MGIRTITDDEAELLFYLHYLSKVKYSISELTTLFGLSKRTVYNYINRVKTKAEKDNSLLTSISEKFKDYESRKDLKEEIEELNYTGTVREISRKLIEIDKKIVLNQSQPVNSSVDVVLQNMSDKVDKIPQVFALLSDILKKILKMLQEVKENQENSIADKLDKVNTKLDKIIAYLEDSPDDSYYQTDLQSNNGYNTKAVKF